MKHSTHAAMLMGLASISFCVFGCKATPPTSAADTPAAEQVSLQDATISTATTRTDLSANDVTTIDINSLMASGAVSSKSSLAIKDITYVNSKNKKLDPERITTVLDNNGNIASSTVTFGDVGVYYAIVTVVNQYGVEATTKQKYYQNVASASGGKDSKVYGPTDDGKSVFLMIEEMLAGGFLSKDYFTISIDTVSDAKGKLDPGKYCRDYSVDKKSGAVLTIECRSGIVSGTIIALNAKKEKKTISFKVGAASKLMDLKADARMLAPADAASKEEALVRVMK